MATMANAKSYFFLGEKSSGNQLRYRKGAGLKVSAAVQFGVHPNWPGKLVSFSYKAGIGPIGHLWRGIG
jgi:hypothetical protein